MTNQQLEQSNATVWAMLCHLTGFIIYFLPFFGNLIVLLIIWGVKGKELPVVNEHAKAALNFQIGMMVYSFIAVIVFLILLALVINLGSKTLLIITIASGIVAACTINLLYCIWIILAAIKANKNELFHYPIKLNLVK